MTLDPPHCVALRVRDSAESVAISVNCTVSQEFPPPPPPPTLAQFTSKVMDGVFLAIPQLGG